MGQRYTVARCSPDQWGVWDDVNTSFVGSSCATEAEAAQWCEALNEAYYSGVEYGRENEE